MSAQRLLSAAFVTPRLTLLVLFAAAVGSGVTMQGAPPASVAATTSPRDLATASAESVGFSSDRLRRLEAFAARLVEEKRLAGVTTLLTRHGKVVHTSTVGKPDVSQGVPLKRDAIYRIASMSKPVTGVAMMMLYEEGKWRLNDPVSRYIPQFAKLQVVTGENADGSLKLEDARRPMTMRELMTRVSALGEYLRYRSALSPRLSEFAILVTAAHWAQAFEWEVHAPIALQAGIPQPVIDSLWARVPPADLDPELQVIYDICIALHQQHRMPAALRHRAEAILGEAATLDAIGICGYYAMLAMVLNSRP